jgi:hypothetical protein
MNCAPMLGLTRNDLSYIEILEVFWAVVIGLKLLSLT